MKGEETGHVLPHPREQRDLVAHAAAVEAFTTAIEAGRLHHAWLIGGPAGIGKATLAYRVARRLLAKSDERRRGSLAVSPDSRTARLVAANAHPNLVSLDLDMASGDVDRPPARTIAVRTVRRALGLFESTSADGGHRVCILDSAEDLTVQAANALLKTLEEPPPRSTILIVSHAPQRVLPTIRSRCRKLNLSALSEQEVLAVAQQLGLAGAQADDTVRDAAMRAGGSVGHMLELLDPKRLALLKELERLLDELPVVPLPRLLAYAEKLAGRSADRDFELALSVVQQWASEHIRREVHRGAARLAPLAELCDKIADAARSAETYNLDRRPFVLSMFGDLADVVRDAA